MTAQLSPDRIGLPPPRTALVLDLVDRGRAVGWVHRDVIGFGGFASESEAAHAAWIAHRAMARRLALHDAHHAEPLAISTDRDPRLILAGDRPIATLVRPGADAFGFEIQVPPPADEMSVRGMAHLVYRALRRSGTRWGMWSRVGRLGAPPA